jgi:AAHS family 4-hydroxybenzoate transporter-like MFS transporter
MRDPPGRRCPPQGAGKRPFTAIQIRCVALAVLAVVLDGFDIQLLGVAIPALMRNGAWARRPSCRCWRWACWR